MNGKTVYKCECECEFLFALVLQRISAQSKPSVDPQNRWIDGWIDGQLNGWIDKWMNGYADLCISSSNTSSIARIFVCVLYVYLVD